MSCLQAPDGNACGVDVALPQVLLLLRCVERLQGGSSQVMDSEVNVREMGHLCQNSTDHCQPVSFAANTDEPEAGCRRQLLPQPLPQRGSRIYSWRPTSRMPASGAHLSFRTPVSLLWALLRLHFCIRCFVTGAATGKLRKPHHTHLKRRARFARCSVASHVEALH